MRSLTDMLIIKTHQQRLARICNATIVQLLNKDRVEISRYARSPEETTAETLALVALHCTMPGYDTLCHPKRVAKYVIIKGIIYNL